MDVGVAVGAAGVVESGYSRKQGVAHPQTIFVQVKHPAQPYCSRNIFVAYLSTVQLQYGVKLFFPCLICGLTDGLDTLSTIKY
jgi:hypothetical protein